MKKITVKNTEEKEASYLYDNLAEKYHFERTKKYPAGYFYNELLEMPATMELLGQVRGKRILDFGCGTGIYAKLLTKKGAKVSGFDISPGMLSIAKKENPRLDLRQGSGYKIPFDEEFDIVLASLVVHYLKDWDRAFKEVSRVLKKNGVFIFSTDNPVKAASTSIKVKGKKYKLLGMEDYFSDKVRYKAWPKEVEINGKKHVKSLPVPFYPKTYEKIIRTILKNGFEIIDYKDTFPIKGYEKLFPEDYRRFTKIPMFCVWKVRKV